MRERECFTVNGKDMTEEKMHERQQKRESFIAITQVENAGTPISTKLSLSLSLSLSLFHTHTLSLSLSHTHTLCLSFSLSGTKTQVYVTRMYLFTGD